MLCNSKQYCRLIAEIFYQSRRSFTQTRQLKDLQQIYDLLKEENLCKTSVFSVTLFLLLFNISASATSYSETMNSNGIFANNELDLQKIKVYGFDFGL